MQEPRGRDWKKIVWAGWNIYASFFATFRNGMSFRQHMDEWNMTPDQIQDYEQTYHDSIYEIINSDKFQDYFSFGNVPEQFISDDVSSEKWLVGYEGPITYVTNRIMKIREGKISDKPIIPLDKLSELPIIRNLDEEERDHLESYLLNERFNNIVLYKENKMSFECSWEASHKECKGVNCSCWCHEKKT